MMAGLPEPGHIYWADFADSAGTEQNGRRPAIVLSVTAYHAVYRRAFIVPVTSRVRGWPTEVALPDSMRTKGALLVDQARFVDRESRFFRYIETAPESVLGRARELLAVLVGLEVPKPI